MKVITPIPVYKARNRRCFVCYDLTSDFSSKTLNSKKKIICHKKSCELRFYQIKNKIQNVSNIFEEYYDLEGIFKNISPRLIERFKLLSKRNNLSFEQYFRILINIGTLVDKKITRGDDEINIIWFKNIFKKEEQE